MVHSPFREMMRWEKMGLRAGGVEVKVEVGVGVKVGGLSEGGIDGTHKWSLSHVMTVMPSAP